MALRPVLITGVALASAGAIVAATPGLMTPPDLAITAADASVATAKKTVTVDRLNLLGLSDIDLNYLSDIFFRVDGYGGYVGSTDDPYYGGQSELYVKDGDKYVRALDKDGNPLNASGNPADGTVVYVAKNEAGQTVYKPVTLSTDSEGEANYELGYIYGGIERDGLVGLAYYLGDLVLEDAMDANVPVISDAAAFAYHNVTSYFYEAGIEETFRVVASELTGGPDGLGSQLLGTAEYLSHNWIALSGAVLSLAAAGVPVAGPDLAAATNIFFFGGPVVTDGKEYDQGIDGVINYVIDRALGAPAPSSETDTDEEEVSTADAAGKEADAAASKTATAMLASARKALPALDKLVNIDLNAESDAVDNVKSAKATAPAAATEESATEEQAAEQTAPKDEAPAKDESSADATADADADAGKTEGDQSKKRIRAKFNLKRDSGTRGEATDSSSESATGGKHRQGKPGSWTPKVHDSASADSTSGGSADSTSTKTAEHRADKKAEKKGSTGSGESKGKAD